MWSGSGLASTAEPLATKLCFAERKHVRAVQVSWQLVGRAGHGCAQEILAPCTGEKDLLNRTFVNSAPHAWGASALSFAMHFPYTDASTPHAPTALPSARKGKRSLLLLSIEPQDARHAHVSSGHKRWKKMLT
jgi:hypothetical protein